MPVRLLGVVLIILEEFSLALPQQTRLPLHSELATQTGHQDSVVLCQQWPRIIRTFRIHIPRETDDLSSRVSRTIPAPSMAHNGKSADKLSTDEKRELKEAFQDVSTLNT